MAAPYSMDLRSRVLKDADAGLSSKELAARGRKRNFVDVCWRATRTDWRR